MLFCRLFQYIHILTCLADNSRLPRRSTRPSALKLYGITELSEAFGIPLDTDSESDDQEFAPTKETLSGSGDMTDPHAWS